MKKLFTLAFFACIVTACTKKTPQKDGIFEIQNTEAKAIPLSTFFSEYSFLRLDLPEDMVLAEVSSVILSDNFLYIYDKMRKKILVASIGKEAKLEYVIDKTGDGPEEYVSMHGMDVDKDQNVYVYDFGRKFLKFKRADFQEAYQFDLQARAFARYKDGFALYTPDFSFSKVNSTIVHVSPDGKNPKPLSKSGTNSNLVIPNRTILRTSKDEVIFNDLNSNTLVVLNEDKEPEYLKFTHYNDSIEPILVDFMVIKNYVMVTLGYAWEGDNYANTAIFDLDTEESTQLTGFFNDLNGLHIQSFDGFSKEEGGVAISVFTDEVRRQLENMLEEDFLSTYFVDAGDYWSPKGEKDLRLAKDAVEKARNEIASLTQRDGNYLLIQMLR
jgi:hypothetical protein